jgi:hypothetical protein
VWLEYVKEEYIFKNPYVWRRDYSGYKKSVARRSGLYLSRLKRIVVMTHKQNNDIFGLMRNGNLGLLSYEELLKEYSQMPRFNSTNVPLYKTLFIKKGELIFFYASVSHTWFCGTLGFHEISLGVPQ